MNEKIKNAYILIVDDNSRNLQILGKILSEKGFTVGIARSGAHALKAIEVKLPDLILLDVMMPEIDGFEVCRRLKKSELTEKIPVIFLTAKDETEDVVNGFELGAADYITKPFNPHELIARVETHLHLKFSNETILGQRNEIKQILHILSHDISNQLQGLDVSLEMTKMKKNFEESYGSMKSFVRRSIDLIRLVSSLRSLAENQIEFYLLPVNLNSALNESLETLAHLFQKKDIQLSVELESDIIILAEKTSFINSVLNNLLTNAIKFSYPGSRIIIKALAKKDHVVLIVQDHGIGIPEDILQKIFEVNKFVTRQGTEGEKGMGFGMSSVKHFIKAYGGEIKISSKAESEFPDNHGTEVKLILKLSGGLHLPE